jgi:SSS family solute:Na+ symporter
MFTFSGILVFVNLYFSCFLGALLLIFIQNKGINIASSDDIFPTVAIRYLGPVAGVVFLIGLISAAFPSADGALTSLTTVVSIDFLGLERREGLSEKARTRIRYARFTLAIALVFFISV